MNKILAGLKYRVLKDKSENQVYTGISGDSEDTFLGIEFYALRLETPECRFKVGEVVGGFPRLDYDVIDVSEHYFHAKT